MRVKVSGNSVRTASSFFILGVINNVLYVMILSAALDLVGATTPKSVVLLANILPSVLVKLSAPYLFEYVPHYLRVLLVVVTNFMGMVVVGHSTSSGLGARLSGVAMASAAAGAGEITFLQISYWYPPASISLAPWASGTGGAGVVGGLLYVAATNWLRISPQNTLLASASLPLITALTYFILLPTPSKTFVGKRGERLYSAIPDQEEELLAAPPRLVQQASRTTTSLREKLNVAKPLIVPYMIPLFLVYFAEYSINQGLSPTLLFDLADMPFKKYRDVYPTYATIYQVGVFISRSSSLIFRLRRLYIPAISQCLLLVLMLIQAIWMPINSIYLVFILIFIEGIFGGLVYVNAFHNVSESTDIPDADKEFSIGVIGVADSFGILAAALWSLWLEPTVCQYQVSHGRPWCRLE